MTHFGSRTEGRKGRRFRRGDRDSNPAGFGHPQAAKGTREELHADDEPESAVGDEGETKNEGSVGGLVRRRDEGQRHILQVLLPASTYVQVCPGMTCVSCGGTSPVELQGRDWGRAL